MQTILSGIKNTGTPHIGSYLGFYLPLAKLYKEKVNSSADFKLNLFIPDLHALTVTKDTATDYKRMGEDTMQNLKLYMACGIDFDDPNVTVYRQSRVPAHSELCVLLNNFTGFGELSRQTQFKDSQQKGDDVTAGFFDYPVLMAADILLYGATYIPTGEDQRQHIELTRDIAQRFNSKFGEIFTLPVEYKKQVEFAMQEEPVRIMSLSEPTNKMSKSVTDPKGTVDLTDTPEIATKKIMSAITDSMANIKLNRLEQPGIYNLLQIISIFTNQKLKDVEAKYSGSDRYGDLKKDVAEVVSKFLEGTQLKLNQISDEEVFKVLESGEAEANIIANQSCSKSPQSLGASLSMTYTVISSLLLRQGYGAQVAERSLNQV
jgi:tryptophanyl-tRNA synthetase